MQLSENSSSPPSRRVVLLIGMHRTGTSVLTNAIRTLGVDFGDDFRKPTTGNPKGYFEDTDFVDFDNRILGSTKSTWETMLPPPLTGEAIELFAREAKTSIEKKFGKSKFWGIKDPRIVRLLPVWERAFAMLDTKACYILSNRHPLNVASSLATREDFPPLQALFLWLTHNCLGLEKLLATDGIVCDYDFMLENPEAELARMGRFLGCDPNAFQEKKNDFTDSFLDKKLNRSPKAPPSIHEKSDLMEVCLEVYAHMRELALCDRFDKASREKTLALTKKVNDYIDKCREFIVFGDDLQSKMTDNFNETTGELTKRLIKEKNNRRKMRVAAFFFAATTLLLLVLR